MRDAIILVVAGESGEGGGCITLTPSITENITGIDYTKIELDL